MLQQDFVPLTLAAIGMGANLGDRKATLQAAWHDLSLHPAIQPLQLSSPYLSAPFEMDSRSSFVNAVALVKTSLQPLKMLRTLLELETCHGRSRGTRTTGYQDRTLDLDLLFWGKLCLQTEELTLPHPRMHERLFVLAPMAELLPQWQHPNLNRSAVALLAILAREKKQSVQRSSWSRDPGVLGS